MNEAVDLAKKYSGAKSPSFINGLLGRLFEGEPPDARRNFIGIDTSCYTTSLAACTFAGDICLHKKIMLQVAENQKGVRQSDAVFAHIKNLQQLYAETGLAALGKICAVAASCKPRPVEGSYMPVFMVAKAAGMAMASAAGAEFIETTHQHAHIYAAMIGRDIRPPFLAAHLSGGTSEILLVDKLSPEGGIAILGGTKDIPAGQLVDRIGCRLGFPFPCGPGVEECAQKAAGTVTFKTSVQGTQFNFSGVEAQAMRALDAGEAGAEVCFAAQAAIAKTIAEALLAAAGQTGIQTALLFGGVICNAMIKNVIADRLGQAGLQPQFADREYSADNAAGLARLAREAFTGAPPL